MKDTAKKDSSTDKNLKVHSRFRSRSRDKFRSITPPRSRRRGASSNHRSYSQSRSRPRYASSTRSRRRETSRNHYNCTLCQTDRTSPTRDDSSLIETPKPSKVIGIFGLSPYLDDRDLELEFQDFGDIRDINVVYDRMTRRSKGYAFIKFSTIEEATRAKDNMNGQYLDDHRIRVDYSITRRAHSPTPGRYLGKSRPYHRYIKRERY